MTWRYLETPHADTVTCRFQGDVLQLQVTSSLFDPANPLLTARENVFAGAVAKDA
jgi:hypothetical protein